MSLVYALIAKSNPAEMRYIGKSYATTPKRRRQAHLREAKNTDEPTYKLNWIRKVLRTNDEVLVITLESDLTEEQSFQREIYLIAHYKALGHRLTNQTLGGEGTSGYVHTDEARAKISVAKIGKKHTEETKAQMSVTRTGKTLSEQTKLKLRIAYARRRSLLHSEEDIQAAILEKQQKSQQKFQQKALIASQLSEQSQQKALLFSQLSDQDFQSLSKADKISYKYWARNAA